jgi:Cu+-exporting ATPase
MKHAPHDHAHRQDHSAHAGHATPVAEPGQAVDPVCGMSVDPRRALSHVYGDVTYYFCSAGCRERFVAEPERFLGEAKPAAAAPEAAAAAARSTV